MSYLVLKSLHVVTAVASISGFLLRGYWMLQDSDTLQRRIVRIAPHAIDTLFLLSGIAMLWVLHLNPFMQPWLLAKFAGITAYVLLGAAALRGPTKQVRTIAFVAAVSSFAYIVGVALVKSPLSWISYLAA